MIGAGFWFGHSGAGFEKTVRIDEGPDLLGLLGSSDSWSLSQLQMQFGLYLLPELLDSWQPLKVTCPKPSGPQTMNENPKPRV